MARLFLQIYVALNLLIIVVNIIVNVTGDEIIQFLTMGDWLIFIIACGSLAICEAIDKVLKGES